MSAPDESPYTSHPDVPAVSAEELVGDELVGTEPRRYPSTIGGAFYLVVLLVAGLAIGLVLWFDWRVGVRLLGADLIAAALLRGVLSEADAGMLAVRGKPVDMSILIGLGALLIFLASDIPDQPGA